MDPRTNEPARAGFADNDPLRNSDPVTADGRGAGPGTRFLEKGAMAGLSDGPSYRLANLGLLVAILGLLGWGIATRGDDAQANGAQMNRAAAAPKMAAPTTAAPDGGTAASPSAMAPATNGQATTATTGQDGTQSGSPQNTDARPDAQ
jgi:hypothetical protein